jgi:hypothetical protein
MVYGSAIGITLQLILRMMYLGSFASSKFSTLLTLLGPFVTTSRWPLRRIALSEMQLALRIVSVFDRPAIRYLICGCEP